MELHHDGLGVWLRRITEAPFPAVGLQKDQRSLRMIHCTNLLTNLSKISNLSGVHKYHHG